MTRLEGERERVRNYHVLVREEPDDILFLHKVAPGSAGRSYGIHAARLAGVPAKVLARAEQVLGELEGQGRAPEGPVALRNGKRGGPALRVG